MFGLVVWQEKAVWLVGIDPRLNEAENHENTNTWPNMDFSDFSVGILWICKLWWRREGRMTLLASYIDINNNID